MSDRVQIPDPLPTTIPAADLLAGMRARVMGFSHYEDDDPGLGRADLNQRVLVRELDRLAAENERLRAERDLLRHQWTALMCSVRQARTGETWERANAHAEAVVAGAMREFREARAIEVEVPAHE